MSLATLRLATDQERKLKKENPRATFSPDVILDAKDKLPKSAYAPDDKAKDVLSLIRKNFQEGDAAMRRPRREFNDLDLLTRTQIDRMGFNSYQPNDGDPLDGNETLSWRSNAMRPVQRNKVISIAAHATARVIFPKIFAWDEQSEEQRDAAQVMEDLMEWSGDQANYSMTGLYATINALVEPASIVYTEYEETYRNVKGAKKADGTYEMKTILDEDLSGFQDVVVPCDELYIENFYEHDIQKQGWLIWRRVHSYSLMLAKYGTMANFQYVKPGVQVIYDDADRLFYEVYDMTLRQTMCEEVIYFNRTLDVKITVVNGVMLSDSDNPNPRIDKRYPFIKFGYELIDGGRFFYYKSLTFKVSQDAKIINSLYPMIVDASYLSLMPPVAVQGQDMIASDVYIPGAVTTLSAGASLTPIQTGSNINVGMNTLFDVEKSMNDTAGDQYASGTGLGKKQTAYVASLVQQNANTLLGPFIKMISDFVKNYGKLRISDILQYMTIADVTRIEGSAGSPLVYKTFILPNRASGGKNVTRTISFDGSLPSGPMNSKDKLGLSYDAMGKSKDGKELYRVNPELFRNLKFMSAINPDILNPMSEETETQMNLEAYDRAINNPILNQEEVAREFLLGNFKKSKRNPDRFIAKQQGGPMASMLGAGQTPPQPSPAGPSAPPGQPSKALPMQMPTRPTVGQITPQ